MSLDMEHLVLVPASVYNKSLVPSQLQNRNFQSINLHKIPCTKLIHWKIFFSKVHSLVDKILSFPRIKVSNSQTLILDGVETGISLLNFTQELRRKNEDIPAFTSLYFTPLVYLRLWFWMRMPKLKREEAGSLSKSERQKLQRLYTTDGAAYGSFRNLVKASNLSVSKVRHFLHSKPFYSKFNLATRKFKRMKAFFRFKK